ncbi:MAG: hypothetical protein R2744_00775 [Bacteroidales bacterium]
MTKRLHLFSDYALSEDNYRVYNWSWCGRYSIPVGLYLCLTLRGITIPRANW